MDDIQKLLDENANSEFGELDGMTQELFLKVKERLENGEEWLIQSIKSKIPKDLKPGSVATMLNSFLDTSSDELDSEAEYKEVEFVYKNGIVEKLRDVQIDNNTIGVVYVYDDVERISMESFKPIEDLGIKKLKIKYKQDEDGEWKTYNIDHLITSKGNNGAIIVGLLVLFLILLVLAR